MTRKGYKPLPERWRLLDTVAGADGWYFLFDATYSRRPRRKSTVRVERYKLISYFGPNRAVQAYTHEEWTLLSQEIAPKRLHA
jgi:hypothetical protein